MSSATPESSHQIGDRGEDLAADLLCRTGYRILDRNWRHGRGELDLVAKAPDGTVVFVEVKTGRGVQAGDPAEWITPRKQARIAKLALAWLVRHRATDRFVRFDAVLVRSGAVEHLVDAFRPDLAGF